MSYFFTILLLLFTYSSQAKTQEEPFELILTSLNQCYVTKKERGTQLAKCTLEKLNKVANPEGYRVTFIEDNLDRTIPAYLD